MIIILVYNKGLARAPRAELRTRRILIYNTSVNFLSSKMLF